MKVLLNRTRALGPLALERWTFSATIFKLGDVIPPNNGQWPGENAKVFATTHWSVVTEAGAQNSPNALAALEQLCGRYWYPVYAEIRRRGHPPADAQDLTQEFFACLLRRNSFARADQAKGRFRSYLLGALNYFLADQHDRAGAEKRGGHIVIVSLDDDPEGRYRQEPASLDPPEALFDRRWRLALLDEAFTRLRLEYSAADKEPLFQELKAFLAAEAGPGGYDAAARNLKSNPAAIAAAVFRLRKRYGELVRSVAAETLANPAEVEDELRQLFA
jgi:DNA-directed RNA polymerase specialized sigma24 family protein